MGEIEAPILLTSTTSVPRVADAVISYMIGLPGNESILSTNPVVGETNDGYLNDIRGRYITPDDVEVPFEALRADRSKKVLSAPGRAPSLSDGKGVSAPPRGGFRPVWADTRWVFWCKVLSVVR